MCPWYYGHQRLLVWVSLGLSLVPSCAAVPAGYSGFHGWGKGGYLVSDSKLDGAGKPAGGSGNILGVRGAGASASRFPISPNLPRPLPFVAIGSAAAEPTTGGWEPTVRTPSVPELLNPEPAFPDLETTRELGTSLGVTDQVRWRVISVGCFMPSRYNFMAEPEWCASIYYILFRCASCILLGCIIVIWNSERIPSKIDRCCSSVVENSCARSQADASDFSLMMMRHNGVLFS